MNDSASRAGPVRRIIIPIAVALIVGFLLAIVLTRALDPDHEEQSRQAPLQSTELINSTAPTQRTPIPQRRASQEDLLDMREARVEEGERAQLALFHGIERSYRSQKVDMAWAGAKETEMLEASIDQQIKNVGAVPSNLDIDCRSSVCRITADFSSRTKGEDWITLFSTAMGDRMPNLSFMFSSNPDGTSHVEAYGLGRK